MKRWRVPEFLKTGREILPDLLTGGLLVIALAWLYYDMFAAALVLSPLLIFWHRECSASRKKKAEERFLRMFREWILLLSSSLTAGYSVENAITQSCRDLQLMFPGGGLMLDELKEMVKKAENNQRPEVLLKELARKYPFEEVKSFVEVFCTARASGGSLSLIIRSTAEQMAQIMDTRREIDTFLAAKMFEQKIMMVMPAGVLLYVRLGSADFVEDLYHNLPGMAVMTVCLGIYLAACLMGRRMVQFDI
ncbi:MAG: type II secretion system F family protein [Lachnospiraceae bacterium]|nr:type II secretion system F family protein [Lachnospiraceae bacterium]MCD8362601.1 type II secretion system F family protein [Lachnospiraceae bacterium]